MIGALGKIGELERADGKSNSIFVFPGPCKTGTTSFYEFFLGHPDVYVFPEKGILRL